MKKAVRRKWERASQLQGRSDDVDASYALVYRHPVVSWAWGNDNLVVASNDWPSQVGCRVAASLVLDGLDVSELP